MAPGAATTAAAAAGAGGSGGAARSPEIIFATGAAALFFLNAASGAYETRGTGAIGVVVVGSGAAYSVLCYDSGKATLVTVPITTTVR